MLILTRRTGETIKIGADVEVTVLGVKGNQVRIGVNAPKDVGVHRQEIYERIQREKLPRVIVKTRYWYWNVYYSGVVLWRQWRGFP